MGNRLLTPIETAMYKTLPPFYDIEFYIERVFAHNENEWHFITNNTEHNQGTDFDIFYQLSERGIVSVKRVPAWVDNSFRGISYYFRYNKQLSFSAMTDAA